MLSEQIQLFKKEYTHAIEQVNTGDQLEAVRLTFLSRNGSITQLMDHLKQLSPEDKRVFGPQLNDLKRWAEDAYTNKKNSLAAQAAAKETASMSNFDVTTYVPNQPKGSLHVRTRIINDLLDTLMSMGYAYADGPEVETEYYNFTALNVPANHPARDLQDTFWLNKENLLLRTQTSPIQIREMEQHRLPLAIVAPGRVYRNEALDATHEIMFSQCEMLFIDKDVSMAQLLATAQAFFQAILGTKDTKIRVRPSYYPFVEPGIDIDASCPFCSNGCATCKKTGWIELLGAGLVHPNVLRYGGINPEQYSGFAFGLGIERLAMIKYGITDIRLFHSSKIGFLDQF